MVSVRLVGAVAALALLALASGYQVYSFEQGVLSDQRILFQQVSILNREQLHQGAAVVLLNMTQSADEGRLEALSAILRHLKSGLSGCAIIDVGQLNRIDYNRYYVLIAYVWDVNGGATVPLVCPQ